MSSNIPNLFASILRDHFQDSADHSQDSAAALTGRKRKDRKCYDTDLQRVEAQLGALPLTIFKPPKDSTIRELKKFLNARKVTIPPGIEREELVSMVVDRRETTCTFCLDELSGCPVKTWPCGHTFHATCNFAYGLGKAVDDRIEPVPCPVCKVALPSVDMARP